MPAKSNTDLIRELSTSVQTLIERVDNLRRDVQRVDDSHSAASGSLADLKNIVTAHAVRLEDLTKDRDNRAARNWQVWIALIGCALTLVANVVLLYLRGH